ncbi:MAG: hypothetical protein WC549_01460 [Actinomycetota bacterium]
MEKVEFLLVSDIWTKIASIGTIIMAVAIVATAFIAIRTLLKDRNEQRFDLALRLKSIWINDKYEESLLELLEESRKKESDQDIVLIKLKLSRLLDYYGLISWYLNRGRLNFEVLRIYFSNVLYLFDNRFSIVLYMTLKRFEKKYYPQIYKEQIENNIIILSYLDNLFYKIGKFQNNERLLKLVEEEKSIYKK